MKNTILIIAPTNDIHAIALAKILRAEFDSHPIIWDSGSIPAESFMNFVLNENNVDLGIKSSNGSLTLSSLTSVWWRRIGGFRIDRSVTDPKVRKFCLSQCLAFFRGVFSAIDIPIINNPIAEFFAEYKALQLRVAQKVGLEIPKTIMSNNPEHILGFWKKMEGKCIYKPFTPPSWTLTETRVLTLEDFKDQNNLRHAPIIVQEKIEKGSDVRVNIFGERVFAATVKTNIPAADLDWRVDLTAQWEEHTLPEIIGKKLILLLNNLGLHYGCIDLRQQPDGTYKFFEVNPSGQFLFAEIDTGQPLLRSLAKLLVYPEKKNLDNALHNLSL